MATQAWQADVSMSDRLTATMKLLVIYFLLNRTGGTERELMFTSFSMSASKSAFPSLPAPELRAIAQAIEQEVFDRAASRVRDCTTPISDPCP